MTTPAVVDPSPVRAADVEFDALVASLAGRELEGLSPREYASLARRLGKLDRQPDVKVAFLSNFTLGALPAYMEVHAAREGIFAASHLGAYGQYYQDVSTPGGDLERFQPDIVVLALSARLLRPSAFHGFTALSQADRHELRRDIVAHVDAWVRLAKQRCRATLLVCNFPGAPYAEAGIADLKHSYGETEFFAEMNLDLLRLLKADSRAHLFDLDRIAARYGRERVCSPKMFHLAKMEWADGFLPAVAGEVVRYIRAVQNRTRKCLVLDLDNTLWGGVVGEDGSAGLRVGAGDPVGEAFVEFQHRIKAVQRRGIVLAVCSKNNPADALAVFQERDEMPLKREDFAAMEINWEAKAHNLRRIASTLNVGVDSLVFIDDNPVEISLVQQMLPEVKTVLLPRDPADFASMLDRMTDFEKLAVLDEDAAKTEQYRQNHERGTLREQAVDLDAYLASLGTRVSIWRAGTADLPRLHQLFNKTNQFNLTTRRYSLGELEALVGSRDYELGAVRVQDRFGDLGIVGTYLLELRGGAAVIDSFVMSCRAMGRGIETAIMNHIKDVVRRDAGIREVRGRFLPTPKNIPVRTFYEEHGFGVVLESPEGGKEYRLEREQITIQPCDWIETVE